MGLYRYETHLHTSEASACAVFSAVEQVRSYKAAGYDGIIVTDHFLTVTPLFQENFRGKNALIYSAKGMRMQRKKETVSVFLYFLDGKHISVVQNF